MAYQTGSDPKNRSNHTTYTRRKFGEIGDFWNRYDRLADSHDQRLIQNLNDNLNILLIVAGLFSAVNTSVIQMATPSLSPDPTAETNYLLRLLITRIDNTTLLPAPEPPSQSDDLLPIWASCLLYSSLSCSILAAVGGLLAKEWLQTFERGGQDGLLQDQVLRRQSKLSGAQRWQFEPIIRLLPTLLLISLALFFCGLIEYLFTVDNSAAGVVIAFAIVGGIFYFFTTSAAVIWEDCPFETSVSKATKHLIEAVIIPSIRSLGLGWMQYFGTHAGVAELVAFRMAGHVDQSSEILSAKAACWLLGTASSPDDLRVAVRNLLTLDPGVCTPIHDWNTITRILSLTIRFIRSWQDEPSDEALLMAQHLSAALMHLVMGYPKESTRWHALRENLSAQIEVKAGEHRDGARRLFGCLELCLSESLATFPASPASIFPYNDYSMKVITLSMIVLGDIPFWLDGRQSAWSALRHILGDKYDDTILALMALAISKGFSASTSRPEEEVRRVVQNQVRNACSGNEIVALLLEGVRSGPAALSEEQSTSYEDALPIFTEILHRLRELPSTKAFIEQHTETLFLEVANLILAVDQIYEIAQFQGASSERDEFMDEASRLLRVFKPPVTRQDSTPIIFNGTLVSFVRCNQSSPSISAMRTLDWLNVCLSESDFVADDTISYLMWGLESTESREEVLQLIYTYVSKWFSCVGEQKLRLWVSKGLISQLLKALSNGATGSESMDLMVPLALRHITKRAASMSRELQESEEIIKVGIDVINSVNSDTGTVGQAYSLLIFEAVLSVWEITPEERRAKQMSDEVVGATKRILLDIEELLGNQPGKTLTTALRSKIGIMACPEPFNLSPVVLQRFLSELIVKKADACTAADLDTIVNRVDGLLFNGTTPRTHI